MHCGKRGNPEETEGEVDQILLRAKRFCTEAVLGAVRQREGVLWKRTREALTDGSEDDVSWKRCRFANEGTEDCAAPAHGQRASDAAPWAPSVPASAQPPPPCTQNTDRDRDARIRDIVRGARAMYRAVQSDVEAWYPDTVKSVVRAAIIEDRRVQQLLRDQERVREEMQRMGAVGNQPWGF